MNFDLSEEQTLLRNLIEKYVGDRYDPARRLGYVREARGFSGDGWRTLAETGILAFPFGEAHGGFGGGAVELITVMEALGRGVVVEPVLPVLLLGGALLEKAGTPEQVGQWLPAIIEGSQFVALAAAEPKVRYNAQALSTRATRQGGAVLLDGRKQLALGGAYADALIVSALDEGAVRLFLVRRDAAGLSRRDYRLVDGSLASDLLLAGTPAEPMAGGSEALDQVVGDARLAIGAELLGLMGMMFDAALDYVKTREQFGQPIGQFQVVQHRMADNYARLELSRSHLYRAAALPASDPGREAALAAAKSYISANAIALGEDAIQLHGGIGTTEELMVGQAFKRAMLLAGLFGDSDWELRRYIALSAGG